MKKEKVSSKSSVLLKLIRVIFICLVVLGLTAFGLYELVTHQWQDEPENYPTTNPYITELGETMVSAHRGGRRLFPQGTMMAFEGCVNSEVFNPDVLEFDLRLTKDDKLIILHDETLDEITDAVEYFGKTENYPADYTYEEIYNLNFAEAYKNAEGETPYKGLRGEDIPYNLRALNVTELLGYVEENGEYCYNIEIKDSGEAGYKAADILYGILKDMELLDRAVVATFNKEVIDYIEEKYPDIIRAASNVEAAMMYLDSLFDFDRPEGYYKFDALQVPPDKYIVNLGTSKMVNYAHKNNVAVQYWTINDAEKMTFLQSIGADCIITDVPDVACEVLGRENKGV